MALHTTLLVLATVSPFTSLYCIWKQRTQATDFLGIAGTYRKMLDRGTHVPFSTFRAFYQSYRRQMLIHLGISVVLLVFLTYLLTDVSNTKSIYPTAIVLASIYGYLAFLLHYSLKVDKNYFGISRLILEE